MIGLDLRCSSSDFGVPRAVKGIHAVNCVAGGGWVGGVATDQRNRRLAHVGASRHKRNATQPPPAMAGEGCLFLSGLAWQNSNPRPLGLTS